MSTQTTVNLPFITADASGPEALEHRFNESQSLKILFLNILNRLAAPCLHLQLKDSG